MVSTLPDPVRPDTMAQRSCLSEWNETERLCIVRRRDTRLIAFL